MFIAWLVYSASAWAQAGDAANIARRIHDLYEVGKFDEALPLAEREVELREASKDNETLALADSLTTLALLYRWSGQLDSAKRVHSRALAIREKLLPEDHPDIAVSLDHLAGIYKILRALKLSQKFYDRGLGNPREKSLPPDHPAIAETLTGLALLGWVQGRRDTEPMLRRALEIREKALPSRHPDIASSLTNLAAGFHGRHRLAEAEVLYERALKMREATLSPSHPDIVMSLYALSRVGLELRDWAKALRYARRATTVLSQAGERANLSTDRATAAEYGTKLHSFVFGLHVLAAHREGSNDLAMRGEAYEIAQLAEKSAAGAALAQMAARQATGSTELSTLAHSCGRPSISGGEVEKVEADLSQFAGSQTVNRLVLTVGRFAIADIFDTNKYANNPKTNFFNWTVINAGTFDYAGDAWGYTYGAAVEWYHGRWTVRAGVFDLSATPAGGNSPSSYGLDPTFRQFSPVLEIEERHQLFGQPGKVKLTAFLNHVRAGYFAEAVALAQTTGTPADINAVRNGFTNRPGISLNVAQQLRDDLGLFARIGWSDGQIEPWDFTDVGHPMRQREPS